MESILSILFEYGNHQIFCLNMRDESQNSYHMLMTVLCTVITLKWQYNYRFVFELWLFNQPITLKLYDQMSIQYQIYKSFLLSIAIYIQTNAWSWISVDSIAIYEARL